MIWAVPQRYDRDLQRARTLRFVIPHTVKAHKCARRSHGHRRTPCVTTDVGDSRPHPRQPGTRRPKVIRRRWPMQSDFPLANPRSSCIAPIRFRPSVDVTQLIHDRSRRAAAFVTVPKHPGSWPSSRRDLQFFWDPLSPFSRYLRVAIFFTNISDYAVNTDSFRWSGSASFWF